MLTTSLPTRSPAIKPRTTRPRPRAGGPPADAGSATITLADIHRLDIALARVSAAWSGAREAEDEAQADAWARLADHQERP